MALCMQNIFTFVITLNNDWISQEGEDTLFYSNGDNWHLLSNVWDFCFVTPKRRIHVIYLSLRVNRTRFNSTILYHF